MKQGRIKKRAAIVTGGAGFVGNVLINYLEEKGYSVTALGRRRPSALSSAGSYFLWHLGQPIPEGVSVKDCRFFHLAHDWRQDIAPPEESLNFWGTKKILEEARAKGISSFLFASSQLAGCSQSNRYGKIKRACEGLLQGPNEISARIGFINGGIWGGSVGRLLSLLQRSKVIPSPTGLANIQPVHVEDVCAAIAVLAETGWEGSSPPFLAGADNFRFSVYVRALAEERLNRKIKTIPISRELLLRLGRCFPGYLAERVVGLAALEPLLVAAPTQCKFRSFEEIIRRSKQRVKRRQHIREAGLMLSILVRLRPPNLVLKRYTNSMLKLQKEPLNLPQNKMLGNITMRWRELATKDSELVDRLGYLARLLEQHSDKKNYVQETKILLWKAFGFSFNILLDLVFRAIGKINRKD